MRIRKRDQLQWARRVAILVGLFSLWTLVIIETSKPSFFAALANERRCDQKYQSSVTKYKIRGFFFNRIISEEYGMKCEFPEEEFIVWCFRQLLSNQA